MGWLRKISGRTQNDSVLSSANRQLLRQYKRMRSERDRMTRERQFVALGLLGFVLVLCAPAMPQAQQPAKTGKAAPSKLADIARPVRDEIDRLMSGEAGTRASGAASLGEMGDAAVPAIPYLIAILTDRTSVYGPVSTLGSERLVRNVALYTLWKLGRPAADAIIASLKSESEETRCGAAWALGELKASESIPPLVDLVSREAERVTADKRPNALEYAVDALQKFGDKRAVPALISVVNLPSAVHDQAFFAIQSAYFALGRMKDPRAIYPLLSLAERTANEEVRRSALRFFGELTGQEPGFFKDPKSARTWWEQNKLKFQ